MVDLHCHVLPGIDDGPPDLETSLAMLVAQAEEGVARVAATPHLRDDHPDVVASELRERCATLNEAARFAGIDVMVEQGGEIDLLWGVHASPADLRRASLGGRGRDLLIEMPHHIVPPSLEDLLSAFQRAGYRITLAHPEFGPDFQTRPERLAALVRRGVLLQVTASSLLRSPRKSRSAALARALVADGMAHVVASDSHSAGPWRPPDLSRGALEAVRLAGARGEWMVSEAPEAILAGEELPAPPSMAQRHRVKR